MSVLHHESILESLYDEVCEEYPNLDTDALEAITKQRFEDLLQ